MYYHKDKQYKCNVCDQKFVYRSKLKQHKCMHTKLRMYECKFLFTEVTLKNLFLMNLDMSNIYSIAFEYTNFKCALKLNNNIRWDHRKGITKNVTY